jgi:acyl-CoA dehydrogenase
VLNENQPEFVTKTKTIAREVAARFADDVDRKSRFPTETFDALRQAKVLAVAAPREFGGAGASMEELAAMCTALAQGCGSSGMILAMHHIQVACIARHSHGSPYFREYMKHVIEHQPLIASITSEVGVWGDTRQSICALQREGGKFTLDKDATTISYAEAAEDLLATCRRNPDAPGSDQILVLLRKGDYTLERTSNWDTLGLRGTCSPGYKVKSHGSVDQVLAGSFADASAQTMVSYSHILWAAVWFGMATDAYNRASAFVRSEARKNPGVMPPKATHLARLAVQLQAMRNLVTAQAQDFDEHMARPTGMDDLLTIGWALKMNNVKVAASEAAPKIVHEALQIIGITGYKNDSKYSVGRQYRDTLSAALMISNDRIFHKTASMLLVYKDE